METAPTLNEPAAILEPEELRRYQQTLEILVKQRELSQRARNAQEETQILEQAMENECVRLWHTICDAHGLSSDSEYRVDETGKVFAKRTP